MSIGARLVGLFPLFYVVGIFVQIHFLVVDYKWYRIPSVLAWIYLFPIFCMRLQNLFIPLREGSWNFSERKYNPWWGSYMFQKPFIACPWLERFLHLVPGLFSLWLRAWGSKVGKRVVFTPQTEFVDRGLLEIGDGVIFGHQCTFSSHLIIPREDYYCLIVKRIKIGAEAFLSTGIKIGPGTKIPAGEKVEPLKVLYKNREW